MITFWLTLWPKLFYDTKYINTDALKSKVNVNIQNMYNRIFLLFGYLLFVIYTQTIFTGSLEKH